jgi:hypothetical protein
VQNFGITCSIGAVLGLAATFGIYPAFLASADPGKSLLPRWRDSSRDGTTSWSSCSSPA